MTLFRALLFNFAFALWTLFLGIVALPLLLAPRRTVMRFGRFWSAGTLLLLRWCVGLSHEVRGYENLPPGPSLIAMKHQSAWDTLALPVVFNDPAVVLKQELMWIPFYGWYAKKAGMVPIDRAGGAKALKSMVARSKVILESGRPVVIFPEGTRKSVGAPPDYQPGIAALYAQLNAPLVPVAVNSGLFWGRRAFMKRPGRIVMEILPPIEPGLPRKQVMAELQARIETVSDRLADKSVDI